MFAGVGVDGANPDNLVVRSFWCIGVGRRWDSAELRSGKSRKRFGWREGDAISLFVRFERRGGSELGSGAVSRRLPEEVRRRIESFRVLEESGRAGCEDEDI